MSERQASATRPVLSPDDIGPMARGAARDAVAWTRPEGAWTLYVVPCGHAIVSAGAHPRLAERAAMSAPLDDETAATEEGLARVLAGSALCGCEAYDAAAERFVPQEYGSCKSHGVYELLDAA